MKHCWLQFPNTKPVGYGNFQHLFIITVYYNTYFQQLFKYLEGPKNQNLDFVICMRTLLHQTNEAVLFIFIVLQSINHLRG